MPINGNTNTNKRKKQGLADKHSVHHGAELFHFLGEVEVVFGIWAIALVGAIISTKTDNPKVATILGVCAVAFAMVNVVGGYMVTHRMLDMFRKKR